MASEIVMPQMGAEMEEGAVVRWLKQPGERIERGEAIAEIETDKTTVLLESYEEGYFLGGTAELGVMVPVGTVIGYLGAQGESLPAGAVMGTGSTGTPKPRVDTPAATPAVGPAQKEDEAAQSAARPPAHATDAEPAPEGVPEPVEAMAPAASTPASLANGRAVGGQAVPPELLPGGRLRASPIARSIAQELGIDLRRVQGSGPDGRIMRRDVEAFARSGAAEAVEAPAPVPAAAPAETPIPSIPTVPAHAPAAATIPAEPTPVTPAPVQAAPAPAAAGARVEPLSRMRQAIARRMAAAKREIPHYYVAMSVDMTEAQALRRQMNAALGAELKLSVNDFILKACALALEKYPRFNWTYTDDGYRMNEQINIGLAVALEDGLVAPAVLNCRGKSLGAIAREAHDVAERARSGQLRAAELTEGTFTVSNLGMYGVETLIAIIQPGQSAILGVGMVEARPVVREGEVVVREMMTIALSADHRVSDGAQGAQFTATIKDLLEHPYRLLL